MTKRDRRLLEIAAAVLLVMGVTFAVYQFGAEKIVSFIGVENTYLVAFLVAMFGGMTSIGGPTYFATIITFVNGGASVPLIALAAGAGITIGDTAYYLISKRGRGAISEGRLKKIINKIEKWADEKNDFVVFLFAYAYIGFSPFPNDVLTVSTGIANVSKRVMLPAIVLGAFTHGFVIAYLGKTFLSL